MFLDCFYMKVLPNIYLSNVSEFVLFIIATKTGVSESVAEYLVDRTLRC